MIDLIVWSKDRACQLDLLLQSFELNCPNLFDVNVLYTYSNDKFKQGYDILIEENNGVNFLKESNFREDTLSLFNSGNSNWVSFCTDDTVFYRKNPYTAHSLKKYLPSKDNQVFSFRLGYNTIAQDIHRRTVQDPLHNEVELTPDIISWDCYEYNPFFNYGYPFALDAHVFTRSILEKLIKQVHTTWTSTNHLESQLQLSCREINYISSYKKSIAVNLPVNNMSGDTEAGYEFGFTNEELNDYYLSGKRLNMSVFKDVDIIGCHQEVKLI